VTQPPELHMALSGDREALEALAARCFPALHAYLARLCGSREAALDLAQDAMVRVLESLGAYRPRGAGFMAWAFRIARNLYIDGLRRGGREIPFPEGEDAGTREHDPTGTAALAMSDAAALRRALARLKPGDRELLELRYWHGFSHREAAEVLGVRPAVVKSRLNAALGRLRRQYPAVKGDRI
jgi:RNA polymerase sigma-70 factor (ECF subfamily)